MVKFTRYSLSRSIFDVAFDTVDVLIIGVCGFKKIQLKTKVFFIILEPLLVFLYYFVHY